MKRKKSTTGKNASGGTMKKLILITLFLSVAVGISVYYFISAWNVKYPSLGKDYAAEVIKLPAPRLVGAVSVEKAILGRRSVRNYAEGAVTLAEVSQLLWAAQGITDREGFRAAPSAGATYPIELYLVAGNTSGFPTGIYKYQPYDHTIARVKKGDHRKDFLKACPGQEWIEKAPMILVFAADPERTVSRYGEVGVKYVHMEIGHASENVYLQAEALNLGTVAVAAFDANLIKPLVGLGPSEQALYLMPVGKKAKQ